MEAVSRSSPATQMYPPRTRVRWVTTIRTAGSSQVDDSSPAPFRAEVLGNQAPVAAFGARLAAQQHGGCGEQARIDQPLGSALGEQFEKPRLVPSQANVFL